MGILIMRLLGKERDEFYEGWKHSLKELMSEDEKQVKQYMFNSAIASLKKANSSFIKANVFSFACTLFFLVNGFREALACAIILFVLPHLISSIGTQHLKEYDSEKLYPIPIIEK